MQFADSLNSFGHIQAQFGPLLDTALLVFARIMAFVATGPIFNRKNLPFIFKVIMAMLLTAIMMWLIPVKQHGSFVNGEAIIFVLQLVMNITIGALLGFIANMILLTVYSAGNVMNNQIGLSSAMLLDPSSGTQTMLLEQLFGLLTIITFIHLGGVHWMIMALMRSFTLFPLYNVQQPIMQVINLDYLIEISGNTLTVAVQMVAPIMVVTMAIDLILGIVNRAAQQMPVFQLSFALKPAIGIAIFLMTLPIFMNSLANYLTDHANIF